ncbi:MAG: hypothetical protein M8354_13205, partial [Halalkalicoccus sp.]|nr:hypothetical protein [Halalkalicoccus sp.]
MNVKKNTATIAGADEPYRLCYLFANRLDLPTGAAALRLPDDPAVRLFALTVAAGGERRLDHL